MAKMKAMNTSFRSAAWGLIVAGLAVAASGCAGWTGVDRGSPWDNHSAPPPASQTQISQPQASQSGAPQVPASAPVTSQPAVRGQNAWGGDQATPGADDHWRRPMPVSDGAAANSRSTGTTRTTQYNANAAADNGVPGGQPAFAPPPPPAPPAVGQLEAGTTTVNPPGNNGGWLTSPFLHKSQQEVVPPAAQLPGTPVPLDIYVEEARTGRFMFGAGVNSEAGVTGQIIVDERNFDLFRFPRSLSELWNGEAFRGAGQAFRVEAVPGTVVQRYLVSFTEPYLFSTPVSLNVSGFLFDRYYYDWRESREGGRLGLGYRLTPDLSFQAALRLENVEVGNPRVLGVPELDAVLGRNELYSGRFTLRHDTRDIPFAPTEGHLIEMSYGQVFGDFDYPRADVDYRRYFLVRERPDGSGRHTLALSLGAGFTGSQTPMFENYFAGGFSTLRGFQFRGASPVVNTVTVGGQFRMLGSVEYMLPLTADDMIKAVAFCDYGTVEPDISIDADNFRVAPGFGFRISIPAMGPAPLAFDFAFPVAKANTDDTRVFSFFFGFGRG